MQWTAWKGGAGTSTGAGFGLKVGRRDRDLHFDRVWVSNVTVCTYLDLLKLPIKHLQAIARLPMGEQVAAFEARWPGPLGRRMARSA